MTAKPPTRKPKDLPSSLSKLALSTPSSHPKKSKRPPTPPDSWEDAAASSSDSDSEPSTPTNHTHPADTPGPPPPTPISPTHHRRGQSTDWSAFPADPSAPAFAFPPSSSSSSSASTNVTAGNGSSGGRGGEKRPEKSVALASRLIAAGVGKKPGAGTTEEGRRYERVLREKAGREREARRREEGEREEKRREVWDG